MNKCELLSPAGEIDSAYAAIHCGADAIYLGLRKFSARAEAENFTPDQLSEITAFAHSLTQRRRVFVTINTLVLNHEIPELIEMLATISEIGVDAVIVQDLGVIHIIKKYFPSLTLHGSTQLAIHNLAGAIALREMGFRRVTLARELTLKEISTIAKQSGIEVETFLHGALCYSYSGLCLYSSMLRGSSGNRGRCNYPCRDSFEQKSGKKSFTFSMKDIALPDDLASLREAGVASLKIEGRKKSPLYVAATTSYYRALLDGKPGPEEKKSYEDDIKTIFSRPWTNLYVRSSNNTDTVDTETVGHRGAPIGKVQTVLNTGSNNARLQFRTERPIERHDGMQIDLPGRPFGFPVDTLIIMPESGKGQGKTVFEAPAGSFVQVVLPLDHPEISKNATIYCSSSQAVKRRYKFTRPKPGEFKIRKGIDVEIVVSESHLTATASHSSAKAKSEIIGSFEKGKKPEGMEAMAKQSFEKLGDTDFTLNKFSLNNPSKLFVPVSILNRLRRDVTSNLRSEIATQTKTVINGIKDSLKTLSIQASAPEVKWSIKTDAFSNISAFDVSDWKDISELVVDIGNESSSCLTEKLDKYSSLIGKDKIRIALPVITRDIEENGLKEKIDKLKSHGWTRWEASNLSAWQFLHPSPPSAINTTKSFISELSSDFQLYVLNRAAALQLSQLGVKRFTLSPEDGLENMSGLLREFGAKATVIIYQDTPMFISETCAYSKIIGKCADRKKCFTGEFPLVSGKKEHVIVTNRNCRSVVISATPYCIVNHMKSLVDTGARRFRVDYIFRNYEPDRAVEIWHMLRNGKKPKSTFEANFTSTIL